MINLNKLIYNTIIYTLGVSGIKFDKSGDEPKYILKLDDTHFIYIYIDSKLQKLKTDNIYMGYFDRGWHGFEYDMVLDEMKFHNLADSEIFDKFNKLKMDNIKRVVLFFELFENDIIPVI